MAFPRPEAELICMKACYNRAALQGGNKGADQGPGLDNPARAEVEQEIAELEYRLEQLRKSLEPMAVGPSERTP
jgi:hypothetical protein